MSRSNYDKPFYVDVGTSVVAIRCASNHDVVCRRDHIMSHFSIKLLEDYCDRMNREFELYAKSKFESTLPTCHWSLNDALNLANTLANHGWTREANADAVSSCIYALCRLLILGNSAATRAALLIAHDYFDSGDTPRTDAAIAVESALAAPPRNCDRFAYELDAQLAFLNEVWLISVDRATMLERDKFENWSDEMRTRYGRWLYAHATERKGDNDEEA